MDVQISSGYYPQLYDEDMLVKSASAVICDSGDDVNAQQTTYLINLEQEDGLSQIVQITEEEAQALGIILNGSSEAVGNVFIESLKTSDDGLAVTVVHHKNKEQPEKASPAETNYVLALPKGKSKERQFKVNQLAQPPRILQTTGRSRYLQLTEEEIRRLSLLSNSNEITTKNISDPPIKQVLRQKHKAIRKKLRSIKKESVNVQESSTFSLALTEENETTEILQLTENDAQAVVFISDDNFINHTDNVDNTAINQVKIAASKKVKRVNELVKPHKASMKKNLVNTSAQMSLNPLSNLHVNNPQSIEVCKDAGAVEMYVHVGGDVSNNDDVANSASNCIQPLQTLDVQVVETLKEEQAESVKPLGSCENPIEIIKDGELLHSTQNLSQDYLQQIAKALQLEVSPEKSEAGEKTGNKSPNIIYRVVYPEELDLNPQPVEPKILKRGRPRKRSLSEDSEKETKPVKNVRTRSGRITRPPNHIKKNFKKIDTTEADGMETDLKTLEFEPLTTNQSPTDADVPVQTNQLEIHQRKRSIASQYRCPKCQKAYLGHSKMLKHLQKHPDHGPIPDRCKRKDDDTWNYFIDLCNKNPAGQRGTKFCKELVNFIHNVRMLAKTFFKQSVNVDKNLYFVDSNLAGVLDIEPGNYILNESELHKEVDIFALLKNNNHVNLNGDTLNSDVKTTDHVFNLEDFVQKCQSNDQDSNHDQVLNSETKSTNTKPSDDSCMLGDMNFEQNKHNFEVVPHSEQESFNIENIDSCKDFNLEKFNNVSNNCKDKDIQIDLNSSAERNNAEKSMNPDMSLHNELLSENSLLNSLPNLRTSVEDLMLNNVDSSQVSNMMDNSTSSDEVMNVDQFVNERFKNLTEPDLELPNTSLSLDLPPLELFHFHTS